MQKSVYLCFKSQHFFTNSNYQYRASVCFEIFLNSPKLVHELYKRITCISLIKIVHFFPFSKLFIKSSYAAAFKAFYFLFPQIPLLINMIYTNYTFTDNTNYTSECIIIKQSVLRFPSKFFHVIQCKYHHIQNNKYLAPQF